MEVLKTIVESGNIFIGIIVILGLLIITMVSPKILEHLKIKEVNQTIRLLIASVSVLFLAVLIFEYLKNTKPPIAPKVDIIIEHPPKTPEVPPKKDISSTTNPFEATWKNLNDSAKTTKSLIITKGKDGFWVKIEGVSGYMGKYKAKQRSKTKLTLDNFDYNGSASYKGFTILLKTNGTLFVSYKAILHNHKDTTVLVEDKLSK
jgi:hypothetical protein